MKPLVLAELYAGVQISNKEVAVKSKFVKHNAKNEIFQLSIFAAGFFFGCGNFARCVVFLNTPLSDRDEKKSFCYGLLFPRNPDLASATLGGPITSLEAR